LSTRPSRAAAVTAAASALLIGGAAVAPAIAATPSSAATASPAQGVGTSALSMLNITAGGHQFSVGQLALLSDTASAATSLATATVTPLLVDGTAYGKQVITPDSSPKVVPSASSPSALGSIVSVASPSISASATNGPSTTAGAPGLGTLKLLGTDVPLDGTISLSSAVSSTQAIGQKTVTLKNLALPSIADILGSLGLDLSKLPVGTLGDLVSELDITNAAIDTAMDAVDGAQAQVDTISDDVAAKLATLASQTAAANTATAAVTSATSALQAKLAAVSPATLALFPAANTVPGYELLNAIGLNLVEVDSPGTGAAATALAAAKTALTAANALVDTAQTAVTAAQATLATVTATLTDALGAVDDLASTVLDATSLLSLESLTVGTKSMSTSNTLSGQTAQITGGEVKGLKVLGTDVLDTVLGSSAVDLTDLVGAQAAEVTSLIDDITGTLSGVLSSVPGFPALSIPAPVVGLLTKSSKTSVENGFGKALTSVSGLSISLPPVTIPSLLALPNAASLPALSGVTQVANKLTSAPLSVDMLTLSDQSAFRPAVVPGQGTPGTGTPGTNGQPPKLPQTGLPVGLTALSVLMMGAALVLRRQRMQLAEI
jgi:hypothetical protein